METMGWIELYTLHAQADTGDRNGCSQACSPLVSLVISASVLLHLPSLTTQIAPTFADGAPLQVGSRGPGVWAVQTRLNDWGFPLNPANALRIDGTFGPQTRLAVLEFQGDRQLHRDGIVGPVTAQALFTPRSIPDAAFTTLQVGSRGRAVSKLQTQLRDWGFPLEPDRQLLVDGRFGPQTQRAVIQFQQYKGLQPDGLVGPETSAALNTQRGPA